AWYMLKQRHCELARRSMAVASAFGLAAALSVVVLGDESGYSASHTQRMKLAAIEAMWETHDAPAPFTLVGFPDQEARETHYAVEIPWVMGLIGTRSLNTEIPGIKDLVVESERRVRSGLLAYDSLMTIRSERENTPPEVRQQFEDNSDNLGYALLLKRYVEDPRDATEAQIKMAADDTVPGVAPVFWAFRLMVGLGFSFIAVMAFFFYRASFRGMQFPRWSLWLAVIIIPTPWIAVELGWFVSEFGRQPWTVDGVLPTALSASNLSVADLLFTLAGFTLFYTVLFIIEMGLMLKYIRKGPYMDVEETEQWMKRHEHRLKTHDGKDPFAPTPAE
ncbi:MAG TPA: cytochrome bd-I ubiquinol oxidase subunit CydA, partial [Aliiroseovarius sp.]|nr:cytochrome bd-I ubiquinol oxidase subunit CydA [Aliiroseovarius sp.]